MLKKTIQKTAKVSFILIVSIFLTGSVIAKKTSLQDQNDNTHNLTQSIDELSQSYQNLNQSLNDANNLLMQNSEHKHSLEQSLSESTSDRIAENLRGTVQSEHESNVKEMYERILSDLAELQKQHDETNTKFHDLYSKIDQSKLKSDVKQSIKSSINVMLKHQIEPIKAHIAQLQVSMLQARLNDNPHLKDVSEKLEHIEKIDLPGIWARIATTSKYLLELEIKTRN